MKINIKLSLTIALCLCYSLTSSASIQDSPSSTIEGKVVGSGEYRLLILNVRTNKVNTITSNSQGAYKAEVMPGRYQVTLLGKRGFPINQQRSPFNLQEKKTISVNFSAIPIGLNSSLIDTRYITRYNDEDLPISSTYYISSPDDYDMRELRIICKTTNTKSSIIEFSYAFISYEQYYLHAPIITFDQKNNIITARGSKEFGDVFFEDGVRQTRQRDVVINLQNLKYKVTN